MSETAKWSDFASLDGPRTLAAANQLLPNWVALALVLVIGWQLAAIGWALVPGPSAGDTVRIPAGAGASVSAGPGTDISASRIAEVHLFGEATEEPDEEAAAAVAPEELENLPETRQNLTLKGIIAATDPDLSAAIIEDASKDEGTYQIGDAIVAGASLHAVYVDRVVLNENGTLTNLVLPAEYAVVAAPVRRQTRTTRRDPRANSIQSVVAQNVSRLADVIRPTPYFVNGQQQGYRVYPGRDRRQFAALGLRPGDLIKQIDGQSLTDPQQAMKIFQSLGSADQVSVTVERDGQPQSLVLKTSQLEFDEEDVD